MERSNPKISVIIPACNVDRCIGRAIESLQNQTLESIEIIVVDEGSADRTVDIAERLAERDIRIEVFRSEDAGTAAARNLGLDRARGEYVCFCDADDWAEPEMLVEMHALAEAANKPELVIAGFHVDTYYGDEGQCYRETKTRPERIYGSREEFRRDACDLFDQGLLDRCSAKLFLRSRIEELGMRFGGGSEGEFAFILDAVRDVERVCVSERPCYHVARSAAEAEASPWRPELYESREEEHGRMLDLIGHWGLSTEPKTLEMVQRRYIERLAGCIESVCGKSCSLPAREKIRQIKAMISTEQAQLAARVARPQGRAMAVMLAPIKAKNALLCYAEGRIVSRMKARRAKSGARRKSKR